MNLIIVERNDYIDARRVLIAGRRARHILDVHRAGVGDSLRVGLLGGQMGVGTILSVTLSSVEMAVSLTEDPPPQFPLALLLAMPRPKCFRRILQSVVTIGVKRVAIFGCYRVEKSYWDSPWLDEEYMREEIILGLEQGRDTIAPVITHHPHFKPFIEDVVPSLQKGARCLVAHPDEGKPCPAAVAASVVLAVGPDGGFTSYEIGRFTAAGFETVSLGARILRTEQAVPCLLGRLLPQ